MRYIKLNLLTLLASIYCHLHAVFIQISHQKYQLVKLLLSHSSQSSLPSVKHSGHQATVKQPAVARDSVS